MTERVGLVTVADIARAYDFGPSHPLRPERVLLTYERIRQLRLVDGDKVFETSARPATDGDILAVHDRDFVGTVKAIDAGLARAEAGMLYGLGTPDNPLFPDMHAASAAVCGASVAAAELIAEGECDHAFNPAGGLHHARRQEASGFCIYNDAAVAIARAIALRPQWRIMYLDIDVHHGDGVQWIFYEDPRVVTVSLHQSGRYIYPGTGFEDETGRGEAEGTSMNVPLEPHTGEDDFMYALERVVPAAAEAFRPDLFVTQLGADTHWGDPLAELGLTMKAYPRIAAVLHETAHNHCGGRWLATGGGGYQAETVVPRVWAMHFAEMCGRPEVVPSRWLKDRPPEEVEQPHRDSLEAVVHDVLDRCLPRLAEIAARA